MNVNEKSVLMRHYSYNNVGAVMFRYTYWILNEADKRGIKRLYFLARDGYLLCKIAKKICAAQGLDIECRYLYCSRFSLRMPTYHFIGDEMYDLLLLGGYNVTVESILMRSELNASERKQIYDEIGIHNKKAKLNSQQLAEISPLLRSSSLWRKMVAEKSKKAYEPAIAYLRQEGLLESDTIALVDSGWAGSMQRSLRQLVESVGFKGKITGFYFGMYEQPKDIADGEYLTYYFNWNSGTKRKIMFNNNLFECMLSANHPMTKGYRHSGGRISPVFSEGYNDEMSRLVKTQIDGALSYTDDVLKKRQDFDEKKSLKECSRLLKRCMVYPTAEEAELYSSFMFCDDTTESYRISMADKAMKTALGDYMLVTRVFRKLFRLKRPYDTTIYWTYSVIAGLPSWQRPWYRINVILWDWLIYILKK